MPSQTIRLGPAQVSLAESDVATSLPSLVGLTITASAITPTSLVRNDLNLKLDTSATYQVMIGLVGEDQTNGGYTVGYCSQGSGIVSLTTGQVIQVSVPNASWPANFSKAAAVALFLKINSADWQLAGFAYLDDQNDFYHTIKAKPLPDAPKFTTAVLRSTTADSVLGDRAGTGYTYTSLTPTTGGVTVNRETTTVSVPIDTAADFQLTSARTATISFQLLSNNIVDVVRGNAGNFAQYTAGGATFQEAEMSINVAVARVTGNKPIKMLLPPDSLGRQEVRLYLGQLTTNQTGNSEAWTKTAPTPIGFTFSAVPMDKLLQSQHGEISYLRST